MVKESPHQCVRPGVIKLTGKTKDRFKSIINKERGILIMNVHNKEKRYSNS